MTEDDLITITDVFGETPFTKILGTLLDHPEREYTKKELAEVNDMSRQTLYRVWDRVEELDLVEESRQIGNASMIQLNTESQIVEGMYRFEDFIQGNENSFETEEEA